MNERHRMWRHRMSAGDRQMLTAAYLPVIAFGAALIGVGIAQALRHQPHATPR